MAVASPKLCYDNRLSDATPVASTTAAGYDVLNLRDWRPYTWWQPTAIPATVTVDCGSAKTCDYAALYAHDCASRGNAVEVRGSTDNFSASDVLVASSTPSTDAPLILTFGAVAYRYWRLRFTAGTPPTIAIAAIGAALTLPILLSVGFDPIGRTVQGQLNRSEAGHPLGQVIAFEAWEQEVSLLGVTWAWLRATWVPAWVAHLRSTPFLFAWDATDHPAETRLVSAGEHFTGPHRSGQLADLIFTLSGVA